MPSNSTNTLSASITATDPNNAVPITRGLGNPTYGGDTGSFILYQNIAALTNMTLPIAQVLQLYVKNLAAAGSGITVTVIGTPTTGVSATLAKLGPGGVFIVWSQSKVATDGYTAISLTPSAACNVEVFMGG